MAHANPVFLATKQMPLSSQTISGASKRPCLVDHIARSEHPQATRANVLEHFPPNKVSKLKCEVKHDEGIFPSGSLTFEFENCK